MSPDNTLVFTTFIASFILAVNYEGVKSYMSNRVNKGVFEKKDVIAS